MFQEHSIDNKNIMNLRIKKEYGFIQRLDFTEWLNKAFYKKGINLSSFCRINNLNYNTYYNRLKKGIATSEDVELFSLTLNNVEFIEKIIKYLDEEISYINKNYMEQEVCLEINSKPEDFIKKLNLRDWVKQHKKAHRGEDFSKYTYKVMKNKFSDYDLIELSRTFQDSEKLIELRNYLVEKFNIVSL